MTVYKIKSRLSLSFDWRLPAIGREIETCRIGSRALGNRGTADGNVFAPALREGSAALVETWRVLLPTRQKASTKHGTAMAWSVFMHLALSKVRLRIEA
jgi:hypothetical protein